MELWLILGIASAFFYAISTSFDKDLMNHKYDVFACDTMKMGFDFVLLLIAGLLFLKFDVSIISIGFSVILGVLYSLTGIMYYESLQKLDVEEVIPFFQSGNILMIFLFSLLILQEPFNLFNILGVAVIIAGILLVINKELKAPKLNTGLFLIAGIIVLDIIYSILAKVALNYTNPITLAVGMYGTCTLILLGYDTKKNNWDKFTPPSIKETAIAALFGSLGTFLLYTALAKGFASQVYPVLGIQSVFVFIIATIFLKEKFEWKRLIGTLAVILGVYLIQIV